nr:K-box region family protein, expressed [Oryza sativa Japonica Group]
MERILEKYDRHELLSEGNNVIEEFPELEGSMSYDHIKLRGRIEALKKSQRNLMGQELDSLTLQDIQQLENQIDTSLNNIRSRKEKLLMEKNTILEKKITELETLHTCIRASPTKAAAPPACNTADAFVPNLNICCGDSGEPETVTAPLGWTSSNNGLPWWMLQSSSNGKS